MNVYVTYNYERYGKVKWGSIIAYNIPFQMPPTEKNLMKICEVIGEFEKLPMGEDADLRDNPAINIFYLLPVGDTR